MKKLIVIIILLTSTICSVKADTTYYKAKQMTDTSLYKIISYAVVGTDTTVETLGIWTRQQILDQKQMFLNRQIMKLQEAAQEAANAVIRQRYLDAINMVGEE